VSLTWVAFSVPMLFSWVGGRHCRPRQPLPAADQPATLFSAVAWILYGITTNLALFMVINVLEGIAMRTPIRPNKPSSCR